jgi:iron complex outermembrane receptor protein
MRVIHLYILFLFFILPGINVAQADTIPLAEVEINSSATPVVFKQVSRSIRLITKQELASAPVLCLEDVLRFYGGVDVRERGAMGVQSDLSIRGGGMDQNLMMVNGVALNDPQTGHHNTNQAISLNNIEKIEILEGPGTRWFGPNAFSGGINLVTSQPMRDQLNFTISGGQHGLFMVDVAASIKLGHWVNTTSVGRHKSDGYARNTDFDTWQVNNESILRWADGLLRIYLGYLDKGFGANSFYSPKFPDQYEHIKSSLASVTIENGRRYPVKANVSWRRLYDRFELFREDDGWYKKQGDVFINGVDTAGFPTASGIYPYKGHNFHRTDVFSMNIGAGAESVAGNTQIGFTANYEGIISNVLGDLMTDTVYSSIGDAWYNHCKHRENLTLYLNHSYINGRWSLAGGVSAYLNSDYGVYVSPGIDVGFFVLNELKIYTTVNRAVRIPTFTDLYYQGPDQLSNPELKPETATTYEIGAKAFLNNLTITGALFHRDGLNLIDWVKEKPEEKWHSMNLTSMKTNGVSGSVQYMSPSASKSAVRTAGMSYTFLVSDKSSDQYLSLYALDYLAHNLMFHFSHGLLLKNLSVSWAFVFQQRNGNYIDFSSGNVVKYQPINRVNLKLNYQYKWVRIYISCQNLFNDQAVDYANIPPTGLWIVGGLVGRLDFSLKK